MSRIGKRGGKLRALLRKRGKKLTTKKKRKPRGEPESRPPPEGMGQSSSLRKEEHAQSDQVFHLGKDGEGCVMHDVSGRRRKGRRPVWCAASKAKGGKKCSSLEQEVGTGGSGSQQNGKKEKSW